jgi:hypothetical protein
VRGRTSEIQSPPEVFLPGLTLHLCADPPPPRYPLKMADFTPERVDEVIDAVWQSRADVAREALAAGFPINAERSGNKWRLVHALAFLADIPLL